MPKAQPAQMIVRAPADALAAAAKAAGGRKGPPPVHLWNPPFCGDIDMEIRRDGTWFHEGTPIGRPEMVRLFASILKREGDRHFLVTPVEKVGIRVQDAPFVAVDFHRHGEGRHQKLGFVTNLGDEVTADAENPIRVTVAADGEPAPYVHVRRGLEALIDRKTFYRLVEIADRAPFQGEDWLGLWSCGRFFPILPSRDLG